MLGLREVDDTSPFVVALRGEAGVPLGNIFLSWQVVVELVDDKSTFFCSCLSGMRLCGNLLNHLILWAHLMFLDNYL